MGAGVVLRVVAGALSAALVSAAPAAEAASWLEKNFWMSGPRYDHSVPLCTDQQPLVKITSRFGDKEGNFWNSALRIVKFDNIREIAWEPWASGTIPRRFCTASVTVSDGSRHRLAYSIIEDGGMIGGSYGVEWCLGDYDRNWAYKGDCSLALPDSAMRW